jgi:hypothetical protein
VPQKTRPNDIFPGLAAWRRRMRTTRGIFVHSTGCFEKSCTTLKAYINVFRGHVEYFELSWCSKAHRVLSGIVMVTQMFHRIQNNEKFLVVFGDYSTFHVIGKISTHNCGIWDSENPRVPLEHVRDSPKVNVFCALSKDCTAPSSRRRSLPVSFIWTCSNSSSFILDENEQKRRIHFQ